ncbi:ATP-binding protein [Sphingomonas sp.]|uniref:sensor histidine kinase NtrY-like n=1 Tax=Sphingomonas sp. TaxID=28214 RepID=UPI003B00541F
MIARTGGATGSAPPARQPRWRRRLALLRRPERLVPLVEAATIAVFVAMVAAAYAVVGQGGTAQRPVTPALVALLLVAILVPAIAVMVLFARRLARARALRSGSGAGGRLHIRLVALFSAIAAIPTLLVVIFASLLFQYGVAFWFSDSARTVLESADRVAEAYVAENKQRIDGEMVAMAQDFRNVLRQAAIDDPRVPPFLAQQLTYRSLSEIALIAEGPDHVPRLLAFINLTTARPAAELMPTPLLKKLDGGDVIADTASDRIVARIAVDPRARLYLYASRRVDPLVLAQVSRARSALGDYRGFVERSRLLQVRFNAALLLVSLLIVGIAIWIAFAVADRLTRPVSNLVDAARKVTLGDLSTRVPAATRRDEIGVLATAFNRMTRRLEEQTGALVSANRQVEARRALTEAVLRGVSAGVISVARDRSVRMTNQSAEALLSTRDASPVGRPLAEVAPELVQLLDEGRREAVIQLASAGGVRTLAVRVVAAEDGEVMTFDDITEQLLDQRRAAWSDVARRIAHEIKNPLTPIQLAAERLQRRYGREVQSDPAVFERLTQTIVRQVGDLRRMVDEFSSFARMPKPVFRPEPIVDIARQALFLHEVAHPHVAFSLDAPDPSPVLVCDRRLLGQALTNIVKNAVEAIAGKGEPAGREAVAMTIAQDTGRIVVAVADTGAGLPADRERLTEPYMTTRAGGTGLGLAIVRKIVEEHYGTIAFADREGGGSVVAVTLDPVKLAPLGREDDGELAEDGDPLRMKVG